MTETQKQQLISMLRSQLAAAREHEAQILRQLARMHEELVLEPLHQEPHCSR